MQVGAFFFPHRKGVRLHSLKHPKREIITATSDYFLNLLLAGKYETLNKQNKSVQPGCVCILSELI